MHGYIKDYPRPQLVRDNYTLLNGEWDFSFDEDKKEYPLKIRVPYTYETKLSGIGDETVHNVVWYKKEITIEKKDIENKRVILHFEGADFLAKVWVNNNMVGSHKGAYARFSFDITEYVEDGKNEIKVKIEDSLNPGIPRGKQRWKNENFGCWYVQTTGIWKSVWMEYVPDSYIEKIKITPVLSEQKVVIETNVKEFDAKAKKVVAKISFDGKEIRTVMSSVENGTCKLEADLYRHDIFEWGIFTWSPENPSLYDVELTLVSDEKEVDKVTSYFGMREIRIENGLILLNGSPLYQRLILDQGYWKDSHLTPPDEEALIADIEFCQNAGFNGVRKHQKLEDERFLYWCDVKGLLVWSEMGATYIYNDDAVEEFTNEWLEIVKQNYSHPAIITWTPFNESWGVGNIKTNVMQQKFTEGIYNLTKAIDPNRPVIVNDGWEHTVSDIITLHDYEEKGEVFFERYMNYKDEILDGSVYHCHNKSAFANNYTYKGQPIIISEYGGIAFNEEGGWGYGNKVKDEETFIKRYDDITTAIKKLPYVCGFCYTQVSDVQQEINGLLTEDRRAKVNLDVIKEINEREV